MFKNDGTLRLYRDEETGAEVTPVSAEPAVVEPAVEPAVEPVVTPEVTETPPIDTGDDNVTEPNLWESLSEELDADDLDEGQDLEEPVVPPAPPAEDEPTPPVETPAVETPAVTPETPATPPAETPPVVQPEEPPVVTPTVTPEATEAEVKVQHEKFMDDLATHYSLTDAEATQMVTAPEVVLPKMLARVFVDVQKSVLATVRTHLPDAIRQNAQLSQARESKASTFFDAWPKLNKAAHGTDIATAVKIYAALHPKATDEDLIRDVGMQVMMKHKLTPDEETPTPPVEETPPVPPRIPASVHGAAPTPNVGNMWENMSQELLEEDDI